ncbi:MULTISPECIES: DUF4952 domain-containing protein [Pseudomonas]|uniref:DUF4952 domain-containing protein n=1 Tax=Pseudomonas TaxID=286 RepID=UPI0009E70255|nr:MULTISPECIES: DUF4952 domain-containing protein [Pseudomonas]RXU66912.1 DUF4952 domain-containing protein [Pseudomonas protegens]
MRVFFSICVSVLLCLSSHVASAADECGDFLRAMVGVSDTIEYVKCDSEPERQSAPLTALYRIKGRDAQAVEQYLHDKFGVSEYLKFVCCLWEVRGMTSYEDKKTGITYHIRMSSEETIYNKRDDWGKIGYFYITVVRFMEDV